MKHKTTSKAGVYLGGGHWAMALPFGRQDSVISIEQYAKLRHAHPPFCNLGRKSERTSGQNVGKDLFFWSLPNFGQKNRLNLSEDHFFLFGLRL